MNVFLIFKEALKGNPDMDYTSGSIRRAVVLLAIPMILEMSMESVLALVDLFFVGHLPNSQNTVQTVGLTESVLSIVYSLAIGVSMAATAMVARRVGEKDPDAAARAGMQAIWVGFAFTVIVSILGFIYTEDILHAMGAAPETIAIGVGYTHIMMAGSAVITGLFLINGIFRGAGDASMAMKSLWIANITNIILCPILINGIGPFHGLGLTGAAIATTTGRGTGLCYQVYHLIRGKGVVKIRAAHIRPEWLQIRSVLKIASPATIQFVIGSCSWILLARLVAETGHSIASAGYQTALRVVMFFLMPAWGLSSSTATLVGQNLGANKIERAEQSVIKVTQYNVVFMALVSLVFILGASPIISLFSNQPDVQEVAIKALRILTSGYIFYGIGMVMLNAFNGSGDTWTPTWISLFGFWFFQIPMAYLLADYFKLGPTGVFIAVPVAETAIAIASYILFKTGKWKKVRV